MTAAQALVRCIANQFTAIDGRRAPCSPGCSRSLADGNVTGLAEALEATQDELPTWRGQNEQSMALAAMAFAKAERRRQIMIALASIGPGATNMVTAAAAAHANRLPLLLLLAGDVFASRRPDPVLQQVENFHNPTLTVSDAFKPVTRLLGPHHPSRADHLVAAPGRGGAAGPCRLRPGLHRRSARMCRKSPLTIRRRFSRPGCIRCRGLARIAGNWRRRRKGCARPSAR
jgi:hypothetical protein